MVTLKNPLLIAFETVAALKTVHAAAAKLGLTQAAITKRIKALESELGITLFLRSRRGMSLTEQGSALLHYCRMIQEAEGQLLSGMFSDERKDVSLTIVGPTSAISSRIVDNCLSSYAKYPFLRLHLRSDDHSNLVEILKRGEADLAVLSPDQVPNEMESKLLRSDKYMLVGPAKWRNRDLKEILEQERIIDFYDDDETTMKYLKKYQLDGLVKKERIFANENDSLIKMFIAGVGFGTLTESIAAPYLEKKQLIRLNKGQVLEEPLALAWYFRSRKIDYFDDLVRSIK